MKPYTKEQKKQLLKRVRKGVRGTIEEMFNIYKLNVKPSDCCEIEVSFGEDDSLNINYHIEREPIDKEIGEHQAKAFVTAISKRVQSNVLRTKEMFDKKITKSISKEFNKDVDELYSHFERICKKIEQQHPEFKVISKCMNRMWELVDEDKMEEVNKAFVEMVAGLEKYIRKSED